MPNLTLFIPTDLMPPDACLDAFDGQCSALCTDILAANEDTVHIMYAAVRQGHGRAAYAELRYRLVPSRTPAVMATFMEQLDVAIKTHIGLTARIRCFGHAASTLHAYN